MFQAIGRKFWNHDYASYHRNHVSSFSKKEVLRNKSVIRNDAYVQAMHDVLLMTPISFRSDCYDGWYVSCPAYRGRFCNTKNEMDSQVNVFLNRVFNRQNGWTLTGRTTPEFIANETRISGIVLG